MPSMNKQLTILREPLVSEDATFLERDGAQESLELCQSSPKEGGEPS